MWTKAHRHVHGWGVANDTWPNAAGRGAARRNLRGGGGSCREPGKSDKLVLLDVGPCKDPSVTADRPLLGRTFKSSVGVV